MIRVARLIAAISETLDTVKHEMPELLDDDPIRRAIVGPIDQQDCFVQMNVYIVT